MKSLITIAAAAMMFSGAAQAATVKPIWNFSAAEQEGARVTAAQDCLREVNYAGTCFTDREPEPVEEDAPAS